MRYLIAVILLICSPAFAKAPDPPSQIIQNLLELPDDAQSFERAKLTLDHIIDPNFSDAAVTAQVDRLAAAAARISSGGNDIDKLKAVRQVIYDPGAWNENRPFIYDHADPYGLDLRNKLLATYLTTRKGNCVSMPILHLIVAERLGLNVSLSTAPLHVFVRYTNANNGHSLAIEATSGGNPTRDIWYHEKMGVTDAQVQNGIYLGVLTKRESIAVMASTVVEWLMNEGRYSEAIDVANVLLEYYPKDVHAVLSRGSAYGELLRTEFVERYPTPAQIPPALRPRYQLLASQNAAAFQQAEAWGWAPAANVPSGLNSQSQ